jgi:DNA-binding SARP family transcriptional activator
VQVRILGPLRVFDGSDQVGLSPQSRRLLGILAVAHGQSVSVDKIAEYLADGDLDGSKLRTAVSRLRKVLATASRQ